jgi:RNA-directed DNA polymerase
VSLATPEKIRKLQRVLYVKAKQEPTRRFHLLYDKVWREDILAHAYAGCRANGGAPGVDGETFSRIESYGVERWLDELRDEVRTTRYKPQPVRRVMIPKASGVGQRPLGIPPIRDRVVQAAALLVLEPIFEADFDEAAVGYRPKRSALDAVRTVHQAIDDGHTEIVDADLSKYFDTIPHSELITCVARRVSDGKMLHLIKMWLKAPVADTDERGHRRMSGGKKATRGTPQGGVITPRTQKVTFSSNASSSNGGRGPCLICAVSSTMFMSRGASDESGQGAPVECGVSPVGPADLGCRCRTASRRYPCPVAPASVPVPSASRGITCSRSHSGADGRHHLEAPRAHRARAPGAGSAPWAHDRADRHRGARRLARQRTPPTWLSGAPVAARCRFSSNMRSIGSGATNSPTPMSCWCRLERGRSRRR